MSQEWYVQTDGEILGPLDSEGLRAAVRHGAIVPDTMVRLGAEGRWSRAATVRGLLPPVPPVPPVPPIQSKLMAASVEIDDAEIDSVFQPSAVAVSKAVKTLKTARKRSWIDIIPDLLIGPDERTAEEKKPKPPERKPSGCESVIIVMLCLMGWLFSIVFAVGGRTDIHIGIGAILFFITCGIAVLHSCLHMLYEVVNELRKQNAD